MMSLAANTNTPNKNTTTTTDDDIEDLEILKRQEKMLRHLILNLENQKQRLEIEEADLLNIIEWVGMSFFFVFFVATLNFENLI